MPSICGKLAKAGTLARMNKTRLEAFSDGVIAILITIMVLELKIPHESTWAALREIQPVFLAYVLSFIYLGIYWNNHHHMMHATRKVSGGVLWANLHLLFWLSLVPWATAWMGENHFTAVPTALYGCILLAAAIAYYILVVCIIRVEGKDSNLARAVGKDWKGKISPVFYLVAIPLALMGYQYVSDALYALVALMWLVPDPRIERTLRGH
jgi:uncharacterized membrane protein